MAVFWALVGGEAAARTGKTRMRMTNNRKALTAVP